jgi:hypothetical protein
MRLRSGKGAADFIENIKGAGMLVFFIIATSVVSEVNFLFIN